MTIRILPRALVLLRRIADALDRLAPPVPRVTRHAEFYVSSPQDFERGWDERGRED